MATKTVRILTGGNNNHQETAYSFNALATDFISPGVVGAVSLNTGSGGSGGFAVNAESSPTMQVRVSLGSLYAAVIPTGGVSQNVRVDMNAFEDITITGQGAGAHYAWLYMNIDPALSANPDANAQTVASLVVSYSTSASVDNGTPALYGLLLSVINISSSPVSIVNANIADKRASAASARAASIDWSTFSLNMKTSTNAGAIVPTNSDQDLGALGVPALTFTVAAACSALVAVSIGVGSTSDFEFRPEVRLGGTQVAILSPLAALGNASGRAQVRSFTAVISLTAGVNSISAGLLLSAGTSYNISSGGVVISALVLGNVTA